MCQDNLSRKIELEADEIIQSITYSRSHSTYYRDVPCNLLLISNKKSHGPFATQDCDDSIHSVDIPSKTLLEDYFKEKWKSKNIAGHSYFNGFITEEKGIIFDDSIKISSF